MNAEPNLRTPLYSEHSALQARIAPFGGWDMPIQYTGIIEEHVHTRTAASLFDTCHMGEFRVCGTAAAQALDRLITCPIASLAPGRCRYGFLLNETGGVLDDLITYRISEDEFMIVVNAGTLPGDRAWIAAHLPAGVTFDDESDETGKLDLQGPLAGEVLQPLTAGDLRTLKYFGFMQTTVCGVPALVSRTGYTGEYGFEVYLPVEQTLMLWRALLDDPRVKPAGLGARDTLRLEIGLPLYGHELCATRTPAGAGMSFAIDLKKDFIGQPAVAADAQTGPREQLVGLQLTSRQSARAAQTIVCGDKKIGVVTSGSFAPSVGTAVALGYVPKEHVQVGTALQIDTGRARLDARVVPLPFYTNGTARTGPRS
ncbi:MAG: glycine cleavage system aminomethyltransferase GcvT [bacterium]|nr:glycine cleavage system aminomethyltransferase GcvT [bacterium]